MKNIINCLLFLLTFQAFAQTGQTVTRTRKILEDKVEQIKDINKTLIPEYIKTLKPGEKNITVAHLVNYYASLTSEQRDQFKREIESLKKIKNVKNVSMKHKSSGILLNLKRGNDLNCRLYNILVLTDFAIKTQKRVGTLLKNRDNEFESSYIATFSDPTWILDVLEIKKDLNSLQEYDYIAIKKDINKKIIIKNPPRNFKDELITDFPCTTPNTTNSNAKYKVKLSDMNLSISGINDQFNAFLKENVSGDPIEINPQEVSVQLQFSISSNEQINVVLKSQNGLVVNPYDENNNTIPLSDFNPQTWYLELANESELSKIVGKTLNINLYFSGIKKVAMNVEQNIKDKMIENNRISIRNLKSNVPFNATMELNPEISKKMESYYSALAFERLENNGVNLKQEEMQLCSNSKFARSIKSKVSICIWGKFINGEGQVYMNSFSGMYNVLKEEGYIVKTFDFNENQSPINVLNQCDQLWIIQYTNGGYLNAHEIAQINKFVDQKKGLFLLTDDNYTLPADKLPANDLLKALTGFDTFTYDYVNPGHQEIDVKDLRNEKDVTQNPLLLGLTSVHEGDSISAINKDLVSKLSKEYRPVIVDGNRSEIVSLSYENQCKKRWFIDGAFTRFSDYYLKNSSNLTYLKNIACWLTHFDARWPEYVSRR